MIRLLALFSVALIIGGMLAGLCVHAMMLLAERDAPIWLGFGVPYFTTCALGLATAWALARMGAWK